MLNIFLKLMMLNKMFMFHSQPNQNTGCNLKTVDNMKRQPKRYRIVVIVVEMSSHFTCPEFTPGLESSKTLFSLNPGVTRDSHC